MTYVAYTLDGSDAAKRPLTFSYNGGPGSESLWLHVGALGPRTVVMQQPDGWMPRPPLRGTSRSRDFVEDRARNNDPTH